MRVRLLRSDLSDLHLCAAPLLRLTNNCYQPGGGGDWGALIPSAKPLLLLFRRLCPCPCAHVALTVARFAGAIAVAGAGIAVWELIKNDRRVVASDRAGGRDRQLRTLALAALGKVAISALAITVAPGAEGAKR